MSKIIIQSLLIAASSLSTVLFAYGQITDSFPTKEISMFKDGTAMYFKQGYFTPNANGQIRISSNLFSSSLEASGESYNSTRYSKFPFIVGTLNWTAPGNSIRQIERRTLPKSADTSFQPVKSLTDLINVNQGKKVKVSLVKGQGFEGKIFSSTGQEVFLFDGKNYFFAPIEEIRDFKFIDEPVTNIKTISPPSQDYQVRQSQTNNYNPWEILIDLEQPSSKQLLEFRYMRKGITWVPLYQIEFLPDQKIRLDFKAELINDLEAFTQTTLNLIVGVPSFAYAHGEDPLISGQTLTEYMYRMGNKPSNSDYENQFGRQRSSQIAMDQFLGLTPFGGENLRNSDLFYYQLKNVSLCTQCRGVFNLTSTQLDYEDLYHVKLEANQEEEQRRSRSEETKTNTLQVWHAIKFVNNSDKPLTTGPAFFFKNDNGVSMPQGQQLLEFTPQKASTMVNVTIAPEIQVETMDQELERVDVDKNDYDYLVKVKGQIKVKNFKPATIDLDVERPVKGDLKTSSLPWKVQVLGTNLNSQNKNNLASWKLTLKPGEEKIIEYFYDFLLRN